MEEFRFRDSDRIGATAAEDDSEFLTDCFHDTGTLSALKDCQDTRCIVLGRTGTGKSALISQLCNQERVVSLNPHELALSYLTNSNVLQFAKSIDLRMDSLYKLLWRHVLVVEILRKRFGIDNEKSKNRFLTWFSQDRSRAKAHEPARAYLEKWGERFWEKTETRIKDIVSKFEDKLVDYLESPFRALGEDSRGSRLCC